MPTIQQLVRKGRTDKREDQDPGPQGCPQRRGVCTRVYTDHPEEAELGAAQGRPRPSDERGGGHRLHPR